MMVPKARPRNPVVLLHGLDDTSRLFDRLGPFLEKRGWKVYDLDLIPSNGDAGLDMLGEQVATYVDKTFCRQEPLDLVGFSMGGLVARYYLQRLAGLRRVQRLITISSPHQGTWTAFLRANAGARQMRPASKFLRELNSDRHILKKIRFTSIWSPLDLMIVPASSSCVREAHSIRVNVVAHALMMRDARVLQLVKKALVA